MSAHKAVTPFRPTAGKKSPSSETADGGPFTSAPDQPLSYPVLNEAYATQIARDRNTKDGGAGYLLRFEVNANSLSRTVQTPSVHASTRSTGFRPETLTDSIEI